MLLGEAGRDATDAFEDVGHSDEARQILKKYYVGEGPNVSLGKLLHLIKWRPVSSRVRLPAMDSF